MKMGIGYQICIIKDTYICSRKGWIYIYIYVSISHSFRNSDHFPSFASGSPYSTPYRAMVLNENSSEVQGYCSGTLAPRRRVMHAEPNGDTRPSSTLKNWIVDRHIYLYIYLYIIYIYNIIYIYKPAASMARLGGCFA